MVFHLALSRHFPGRTEKNTINLKVGAQDGVISKYKSDKTSSSVAPYPGYMVYINKPTTLKTTPIRAKLSFIHTNSRTSSYNYVSVF